MFGPDLVTNDTKGLVPRAASAIFQGISHDLDGSSWSVQCSFLEIYNEEIHDLLNPEGK